MFRAFPKRERERQRMGLAAQAEANHVCSRLDVNPLQMGWSPIAGKRTRTAPTALPLNRRGPHLPGWVKAAVVGGVFIVAGVAAPNILGADKNSACPFTGKQMGPYISG